MGHLDSPVPHSAFIDDLFEHRVNVKTSAPSEQINNNPGVPVSQSEI